jgi:hypothetical protein
LASKFKESANKSKKNEYFLFFFKQLALLYRKTRKETGERLERQRKSAELQLSGLVCGSADGSLRVGENIFRRICHCAV